jgi:Fis family transcriptional regulator
VKGEDLPLAESVEEALERYLEQLDGEPACDLYDVVLTEVERPLLHCVMAYVDHNQTRAAALLGLNRGTLRKKLKSYGII